MDLFTSITFMSLTEPKSYVVVAIIEIGQTCFFSQNAFENLSAISVAMYYVTYILRRHQ